MCVCFILPLQRSVTDPCWLSLFDYKITPEWQEWTWVNILNGTVEVGYLLNLMSPGSLYHQQENACCCSQPFNDLCPWAQVNICEYLLLSPLSNLISRIFWSAGYKHVEAEVLLNFKETLVPEFPVKRCPGYLKFQINYGRTLLPCSKFCAGRITLQLLIPKHYFEDKLPKMTDNPLAAKTSPCDDSLILLKCFSAV